jgi:hypothetical protein
MTNTQADEVFAALVAAVPTPPTASVSSPGSDIYPYALDNVQDEKSDFIGELQRLAMSEYGVVFVRAGTLVFEGRKVRGVGGSVLFTLDEDIITSLAASNARDDVLNRVQVGAHPRRVDSSATTVLGTVGSAQRIEVAWGGDECGGAGPAEWAGWTWSRPWLPPTTSSTRPRTDPGRTSRASWRWWPLSAATPQPSR